MADISTQIYANAATLKARGFHMLMPPVYIVALDPAGDGNDNNAVVMLGREEHQKGLPTDPDYAVEFMLRVKMALRVRKDAEFSDVLAQMYRLHRYLNGLKRKGISSGHVFMVETNGVGYGYCAQMQDKLGSNRVLGYTTVGTMKEDPNENKRLVMPRLAGLDNLRIMIETGHFKIEKDAPGAKEFEAEFRSFVWRAPGRPEALEGHHDDLVMGAAGATWCATKLLPPLSKQASFTAPKNTVRSKSANIRVH